MKSICILLTDHKSINENIILKSSRYLKDCKLKTIYLIGSKNKFKNIFKHFSKNKKFVTRNININNNNYKKYLSTITSKAVNLYLNNKIQYIINMPLNKKKYLYKKFPGYTEYFSYTLDKQKNENMLLFNAEKFSVCPLTTHIEIKDVNKQITESKLTNCIENLIKFFKIIKKKINIVILGLNPHASKDFNFNTKDTTVIKNLLKKKYKNIKISGPISADTAFNNLKEYTIFIGMYHDQVLIPFKLINGFNGINITIGKKITRLSPDHGTANNLVNKKKINNKSFLECIKFCEKY